MKIRTLISNPSLAPLVLILVCVVASVALLWARNYTKTAAAPAGAPQASRGAEGATATTAAGSGSASKKGATATGQVVAVQTNPSHPQAAALAVPTGAVLNKTTISLSSSDSATNPAMDSTCQTVFEASCGLRITSPDGTTVKSVAAQAVNDQGAVDLRWNAQSVGLTPGTWRVQLLASKSGQSSLGDSYNLVVQP